MSDNGGRGRSAVGSIQESGDRRLFYLFSPHPTPHTPHPTPHTLPPGNFFNKP
ncbi:MAG: hypothetical protein ACK48H_05915 [Microcystis sp.]|uniref:hypothetical protein n=1 Tax=Microcystis TaxID=1125 RepID=UPI0022486DC0|nr:hypothetical protein [Microcystis aeruginosa]UZO75558.1 hypothetical protein M8120_22835 [Microcystis aeruginosa str. Chao 1910]